MKFRFIGLFVFIMAFAFCGCHRKSFGMIDDSDRIHINRFDCALLQWIESDDPAMLTQIKTGYPQMLEVLGKALFKNNRADSSVFFKTLIKYYSEPTLLSLYKDAVNFYSPHSSETTTITEEL
mgnify:CR=1 FL=1